MENEGQRSAAWFHFKDFMSKYGMMILELLLIIIVCIVYALKDGHTVDFYPINGTFQNYNPIRRLLAGQIPYRDFTDYLGLGHLYLGSAITWLFGANYKGSLIAFSFLAKLGLAVMAVMMANSIFKKRETGLGVTIFLIIMILHKTLFYMDFNAIANSILTQLFDVAQGGTSARSLRSMILPITVFLVEIGYSIYQKQEKKIAGKWMERWVPIAIMSFISGFAFIWSNDYGISCFICGIIMVFWISLSRSRRLFQSIVNTLVEIIGSMISMFIFVEIFTLGHFIEWFHQTFGTGSYQSWYYGLDKSFYIFDIDTSFLSLLQFLVVVVYLVLVFKQKASVWALQRYAVPGFANMVCFAAVNEYKLLSGGDNNEIALFVLFLTICYELLNAIITWIHNDKMERWLAYVSVAVLLCIILEKGISEWKYKLTGETYGTTFAELGGNMLFMDDDLEQTHAFLNGEDVFATYASAQEVLDGRFQPSGTDYIIHVLGDDARQDYLQAFTTGDFKYAATIKKDFSWWEYWAERANWFFYRELYANWHPVYENTYEMYWERNTEENENTIIGPVDVQIEVLASNGAKLIIDTDESVNGIADVYIDYSIADVVDSPLSKYNFQKILCVCDDRIAATDGNAVDYNYLRDRSAEYIPIRIVNGYGEVTISSQPAQCSKLLLNHVSCDRIYTVLGPSMGEPAEDYYGIYHTIKEQI